MIIIILKSNCSGLPTRAINASVTVTSSLTDALIPSRCEKGVQCARPWHWTPVICDAVLAAVCEPPLCVSLLSSWYAPPHQTSEYVRVCACVRVVRKQAAEAGLEMDLVAAASPPILFSVFFFFTPTLSLSSSTSLCRDFHSAPPPLIRMQPHASHPCWGGCWSCTPTQPLKSTRQLRWVDGGVNPALWHFKSSLWCSVKRENTNIFLWLFSSLIPSSYFT